METGTTLFAPTPTGDRYSCICLDPGERESSGGLILIDKHQQKVMRWLIVAAGPGKWSSDGSRRLTPQFKVGDIVFAYKLSTYEKIPGCDLTMGRDVYVIAESVMWGPVQGVEWPSVPEVEGWRERGAGAKWPGAER